MISHMTHPYWSHDSPSVCVSSCSSEAMESAVTAGLAVAGLEEEPFFLGAAEEDVGPLSRCWKALTVTDLPAGGGT